MDPFAELAKLADSLEQSLNEPSRAGQQDAIADTIASLRSAREKFGAQFAQLDPNKPRDFAAAFPVRAAALKERADLLTAFKKVDGKRSMEEATEIIYLFQREHTPTTEINKALVRSLIPEPTGRESTQSTKDIWEDWDEWR